jgi:hypothetical protein
MKLHLIPTEPARRSDAKVVCAFGLAQLLRHPSGRWELLGGTRTDRMEAREWISVFCHEAVLPPETRPEPVSSRPARPCPRARLARGH